MSAALPPDPWVPTGAHRDLPPGRVPSLPDGLAGPGTKLDHDTVWQALLQVAAHHPEAEVTVTSELGDRIVEPPLPLLEVFGHFSPPGVPMDRVATPDRSEVVAGWQQTRAEGVAYFEATITDTDGPHRVCCFGFDLRADLGCLAVVLVAGTPVDIAELAVDPSPLVPRRLVHAYNESGVIEVPDPATELVLGWRADELVGRPALGLIHPRDHESAIARWITILETPGSSARGRMQYHCADGSWMWFEVTTTNLLEAQGHVQVELVDVTEEMAALSELRQREELLARMTAVLPTGIGHFDAGGSLMFRNSRLDELTGLPDARGLDDYLAVIAPRYRDEVRATGEAVLADHDDRDLAVTIEPPGASRRRCQVALRTLFGDGGALTGLLVCVDDVTESWELAARLAEQASTDPLTGLANRTAMLAELDAALARSPDSEDADRVGVVFLDLDGFKRVNDRHGHRTGDGLLCTVADRLRSAGRVDDLIARLGGDEFVVVCPGIAEGDLGVVAHRLLDAVTGPSILEGVAIEVRASCGYSSAACGVGRQASHLIGEADLAMYAQKRRSSPEPGAFSTELFESRQAELLRHDQVAEAVRSDELMVVFQSIHELATGDLVGQEGLVRWAHGGRLLVPDDFLDAAEQQGLARELGERVQDQVVRAAADPVNACSLWTINVSWRQLAEPDWAASLIGAVTAAGLAPASFAIELADPIAREDRARANLRALREAGVRVLVDDFGTGRHGLEDLRHDVIDGVKIDRSYVADLGDDRTRRVLAALVNLAGDLGFTVIAEGIETAEDLETLLELGVERGQGYYFSRPRPLL